MSGHVEDLGAFELEHLARFLLHHMGQDVRGKLMAESPVLYVKLFPHTAATVRRRVDEDIRAIEGSTP